MVAEQLVGDPAAGAGIERRQRLVQQQQLWFRASARASATRWRSPPESRRGLAFARWAMPIRSSSGSTGNARAVGDVRAHAHVREERVVLEHEADAATISGHAAMPVEPQLAVALHAARGRREQPGDQPKQRRLAGAGRADHGGRLADVEVRVERERPKRIGHAGVKRNARPRISSFTEISTNALTAISSAAQGQRLVEALGETRGRSRPARSGSLPARLPANRMVAPNSPKRARPGQHRAGAEARRPPPGSPPGRTCAPAPPRACATRRAGRRRPPRTPTIAWRT